MKKKLTEQERESRVQAAIETTLRADAELLPRLASSPTHYIDRVKLTKKELRAVKAWIIRHATISVVESGRVEIYSSSVLPKGVVKPRRRRCSNT